MITSRPLPTGSATPVAKSATGQTIRVRTDVLDVEIDTVGGTIKRVELLQHRGVTDPNAAASKAIVEYTWGKLWNARAYSACSQMPRAGHKGILTEKQLQHVMALLLDPKSPVNQ